GPQYDLLGDDDARVELAARIHLGEAVGPLRGLQLDFVFREAVLLQESANHFRIALHLCLRFGEIIARHDKAQRPKREIGLHFPFGKPFYRNSAVAEARLHKTLTAQIAAKRDAEAENQRGGECKDGFHGSFPWLMFPRLYHADCGSLMDE